MEIYYNNVGIRITPNEFMDITSQGYLENLVEIVIAMGDANVEALECILCEEDLHVSQAQVVQEAIQYYNENPPSQEDIHMLEILRSLEYLIPGDEVQ